MKGNSTVEGDTTINGNVSIGKDIVVNGNSTTKGDSIVEGNRNVTGSTVLHEVTINKSLTLADDAKIDLGNSDIEGNFDIYGDESKKSLSQALTQLQMTGP
ncbi:hypothetical protein, partial [Rodentibacter caecimuris]